jgi:hypothetical protein
MNSFRQSSLLVTGTLALAVAAWAQTTSPTANPLPPESPRASAPGVPPAPVPAAPDQEMPTELATPAAPASTAEPVAAPAPLRELNFAEADTDGDKKLSLTEYSIFVGSRMATRGTETVSEEMIQRFRQLDQNKDAFLTEAEARNAPQPR